MSIRAIFFDLDDTLHDHLFPFADAFKASFPELYAQVEVESVYKKFREASDVLWVDYSKNKLDLEELRRKRIILALKNYDIVISDQIASEFQNKYEDRNKNLRLFPDVPDILQVLKDTGNEIGIITNGPVEHQMNKIKTLDLFEYVAANRIFVSDAVGVAKPNPQIFDYVAAKFGYSSQEALYIGDSWPNDVVASMEAGWQAIWYNHRKRQQSTNHRPLAEINHLASIVDILK